jgi:signal peptidase II
MSFLTRNRIAGLMIAAVIAIVDQAVKRWVVVDLGLRQRGDQIVVTEFFNLTRENNFGVSLGMFAANSMEMRWALVGLTGAIALFVLVWMMREKAMADVAALALILGGALGNIRDRFYHGYVIDYADLHFGEWRPFLIFNVADAAITIGVLIILARTLLSREKPETEADTIASES